MKQPIEDRLRDMVLKLRTKPIPLSEVIPLLTEAADEVDMLNNLIYEFVAERDSR